MEEEKKHMDELIVTYLTEGLDKSALAELKAWIAASTENENYFIQQREVWFSAVSREAASKYNKDKAFDNLARVGIKMTGNNGMFLSVWGPSQTENYLHVCVFGRDAQNDMFNGWDAANNGRVEDVRTALSGNGMQIRMVRAGDKIRMFVYLNNAWVELVNNNGVATCEESAETDIRLLILAYEWEFSNIEYSVLEHVEANPATVSQEGNRRYVF